MKFDSSSFNSYQVIDVHTDKFDLNNTVFNLS